MRFVSPHAISVYVIHEKKFLLIHRCGDYLKGTWQMVTGKIEPNETAYEAAFREVQEETGLVPDRLYSADAVETFYMMSIDKIAFVPAFVAFVSSPSVRLAPQEHDAYAWLSVQEAQDRVVWAEQKRIFAHVHENFVLNKPSHNLYSVPEHKSR